MKWLILLTLLASCGKNTEPSYKDLSDSDGDQISNYEEEKLGHDKYFANISTISPISGTIAFEEGAYVKKKYQLNFSNEKNLASDSIKLLTKNLKVLPSEDYFQEWQTLSIKNVSNEITFEDENYNLHLEFTALEKSPQSLALQYKNTKRILGSWSSQMKVSVSKQELKDILSEKAQLTAIIMPTFSETIKSSTYRVLFNNGKESKVIYVSNLLSREALLEKLGAKSPRSINPNDILNTANTTGDWWIREISSKDIVLVKTTFDLLKKSYMKNFENRNEVIRRVNGSVANTFKITKSPDAMVYLKVRLSKTRNYFQESTKTEENCSGRQCENFYRCNMKLRTHQNETPVEITKDDLNSQVHFSQITGQVSTYENTDENGRYYEIVIKTPEEAIELSLDSLNSITYVTTGIYNWSCDSGNKPKADLRTAQLNYEGKFIVNIEAFIEKI